MNDPTNPPKGQPHDTSPLTEKEISEGFERLDVFLRELARDEAIREFIEEGACGAITEDSVAPGKTRQDR